MAQLSKNGSSPYLECPLAGAELVHDAAEGPHVRLGVVGPALTQLCKWRSCDRYVSERRARIFKRLWSPGIDSKEWIPPAYVAWRAGTIALFLLGS